MCWRKNERTGPQNRHIHINSGEQKGDTKDRHVNCTTCVQDYSFCSNYVSTTKYNIISFLPKNLFEQFQKKANLYFLVVAIISLTPLSPKTPFVSVAPLVFVLAVSAIKEAIEDYARYKMDKEINHTIVKCWRNSQFEGVTWQDITVGDLVMVHADQSFPADLLILQSSSPQGHCTIETANLDGETNLKVRQAAPETYGISCNETGTDYVKAIPGCAVESSAPNKKLDMSGAAWSANLTWDGKTEAHEKVALSMLQLLLRGCTLRNTKWVLCLVIFTGDDTKLMMNNTPAKHKRSNVDRIVDRALYLLFFVQACFCSLGAVANYIWLHNNAEKAWYLPYVWPANKDSIKSESAQSVLTYLVLLDILIPISLYVSMELVKFVQAWYINQDLDMYYEPTDTPAKARTSNLNEELGQVQYIFSDKTGTLTANIMKFSGCSVNGIAFGQTSDEKGVEDLPDRKKGIPPTEDLPFKDPNLERAIIDQTAFAPYADEFLTLLATCHSVLPEFPDCDLSHIHKHGECKGVVAYQAASPDEKALVIAAKNNQYYYYHQEPREYSFDSLTFNGTCFHVNVMGKEWIFDIYEVFKFDSERARMSVILRDPRDKKIKVYTKGSDTKIFPLLVEESKGKIWANTTRHLTEFAALGLRTLCVAYREISDTFFVEWMTRHKAALAAVDDRETKVAASYAAMENSFTLIGATAIEDKLQDGVPQTIAKLAEAGIRLWVLTGDKVETAINIGRSCRLLTDEMEKNTYIKLVVKDDISEEKARDETNSQLEKAYTRIHNTEAKELAVVVSGRALGFIFTESAKKRGRMTREQLEEERKAQLRFLEICQKCQSVICCRVSPHQKAEVVNLVKKNVRGAITLAIGDGANDVSMIKAAHVGIGISGLEGLQAVMASDYAIAQFRFLEKLLLVHGQWSYRRTSLLILYSFYKNIAISITQIWFAVFSGFSAQMFYDPYAGSCYNMIFTAFPIMLAAIFNQDISKERTLEFPQLFLTGIRNECFNLKKLLLVFFEATWQSVVLFFAPMLVFCDNFLSPGTGGGTDSKGKVNDVWIASTCMYTCLLFVVTIRVGLDTKSWNWVTFLFFGLSILAWFCFALIYSIIISITPNMYYVAERLFGDVNFWLLLLLIPAICNLPDIAVRYYRRMYFPKPIDIVAELDRASGQSHSLTSEQLKHLPYDSPAGASMPVLKPKSSSQMIEGKQDAGAVVELNSF